MVTEIVCEVPIKWTPFLSFPLPFLRQMWPESPFLIYSSSLSSWRIQIARLSDPNLSFSTGDPSCQSQAVLPSPGPLWNPQSLAKLIVCVGICRSLYRTHVSRECPLNETIWIIWGFLTLAPLTRIHLMSPFHLPHHLNSSEPAGGVRFSKEPQDAHWLLEHPSGLGFLLPGHHLCNIEIYSLPSHIQDWAVSAVA